MRKAFRICSAPAALTLILVLPAGSHAQEISTGFDVARNGYSFPNRDWGRVCYSLNGPTQLRYDANGTFCNSGWGLCGGMSLSAGERFLAGLTCDRLSRAESQNDIVNGQFRTLDSGTVMKFLNWITAPDVGHTLDPSHSIGYRMKLDWENSIKPALSARKPVVLGLIFDKRAQLIDLRQAGALADLTNQHQVLGIGFKQTSQQVELRAYDPNYPKDVLLLSFTLGAPGVDQRLLSGAALTRRRPRGVMYVRSPAQPQVGVTRTPAGVCPATRPRCCERDENGACTLCVGSGQQCP